MGAPQTVVTDNSEMFQFQRRTGQVSVQPRLEPFDLCRLPGRHHFSEDGQDASATDFTSART